MTKTNLAQLSDIMALTGLSKATIYRLMKQNNFPRPIQLSTNRVAWRIADVLSWIDSRPISEGF